MNYKVIIKPSAQKDLDTFPFREVLIISKKIEKLSLEPRPIGIQN